MMGTTNPNDFPLTVEWDRGATPAVWAELDRYRLALAAMQHELAQSIEKRDMLTADEPANPFEHDNELTWTGGKIAGLMYAVNALIDGAPQ